MLTWIFYATLAQMLWMVKPWRVPTTPVSTLEPFESPTAMAIRSDDARPVRN